MKKALAAVLLLITVFALTACQTQSPNDTATNDPGVTASHEVTHIGNNVSYSIMKADSDEMGTYYLSRWMVGENIFSLYGVTDLGEMEKILKNIKN